MLAGVEPMRGSPLPAGLYALSAELASTSVGEARWPFARWAQEHEPGLARGPGAPTPKGGSPGNERAGRAGGASGAEERRGARGAPRSQGWKVIS